MRFENEVLESADFSNRCFEAPVQFVRCTFVGAATFLKSRFTQQVMFSDCRFMGTFDASAAVFESELRINSEFMQTASFDRATFHQHSHFERSHFHGDAYFRYASFRWDVSFASMRCDKRLNFRGCRFNGYADFTNLTCLGRVKFLSAVFSDEVRLQGARIGYVKNLSGRNIVLDGAILSEAHFHGIVTLERYSFRDCFLLSCSFADKTLVDCDFTGAVFKAVLTDGWKPDDLTVSNTKYIYTDYESSQSGPTILTSSGIPPHPKLESRVPLTGEFGEGEYADFTLRNFFASRSTWQLSLALPDIIRTAVLNYLQFFSDFMRMTENIEVEVRSRREGDRIRLQFVTESSAETEILKARLQDYLTNLKKPYAHLSINFRPESSSVDRELFNIKYEYQISTLKTELKYVERLLLKEEEKNRYLLSLMETIRTAPNKLLVSKGEDQFTVDVFFLTADLQGYSEASLNDKNVFEIVQTFLLEMKTKLSSREDCELIKLEGDCIKIFARDGIKLIWIARDIIGSFDAIKLHRPIAVPGFRVVLGYGQCLRSTRDGSIDFAGECIIDTVRVDQPMKNYIKSNGIRGSQIWCTQSFYDALKDRHPNVRFVSLPPLILEKGHLQKGSLFIVEIA